MNLDSHTLKNGEQLTVEVVYPPLSDADAARLIWWDIVRPELQNGTVSSWLNTLYFIGKINGEWAGNLACYTPADTRDVGVVEFVHTAEAHRRKGVASVLLTRLIENFTKNGGQALYLCTANPDAGTLYEKHGFWYQTGDGMRYLAPGAEAFDQAYFTYDGTANVREAHWGDLPRASALYNHADPNWIIKNYLTKSFNTSRFEVHFMQLMKRVENHRGIVVVLENPVRHMVGMAVMERFDSYHEQHVAEVSIRICSTYMQQASDLLQTIEKHASDFSISVLQMHIAARDKDQCALVKAAGFDQEARLKYQLLYDDEFIDVLVYRKHLNQNISPFRTSESYYGCRFNWQQERLNDQTD